MVSLRIITSIAMVAVPQWEHLYAWQAPLEATGDFDSVNDSILRWFTEANQKFIAGDFRNARILYERVANRCPGTELCLQCEYFSAISAWNENPNEASVDEIKMWLEKAKAFEQKLRFSGAQVVSPSWSHWIQSALVVLAKWEASRTQFEDARAHLMNALVEAERSQTGIARIHCELGNLYGRHLKDLDAAASHLEKALALVGSDRRLKNTVLLGMVNVSIEKADVEKAKEQLQELAWSELNGQQMIEAKLAQAKVQPQENGSGDPRLFWEEAIQASQLRNIEPSVLARLATSLQGAGLVQDSTDVLAALIRFSPRHPLSVEARVQLAYYAANEKDWQRVKDLTVDVIELGEMDDPSSIYAMYLSGRAKMETGEASDGVSQLKSLLEVDTLPDLLATTIHFELAQIHYLEETWDQMAPHVEWLAAQDDAQDDAKVNSATMRPRIRLWQAELLAHRGEWERAEKIVSAIRSDFPEWNRRQEVDYLLSRCFIARADFDSARQILHEVAKTGLIDTGASQKRTTVLAARAAWMIGETFMMQQRYEEASLAYGEVLRFPEESFWCAASLVQRGVCAERLGRFQEAKGFYEQVISEHSESPFAQTARTRMADNSFSTQQVERVGSGTKR